MPSPFDAIDAAVQSAIDQVFGEGIRIHPQAGDVNYGGGPDTLRPARDARAVISRSYATERTDFLGTNRPGASGALAPSEAWLDSASYAALGYAIRRGDILELTEEAGAPRLVVAQADYGRNGDVNLHLVASGSIA